MYNRKSMGSNVSTDKTEEDKYEGFWVELYLQGSLETPGIVAIVWL